MSRAKGHPSRSGGRPPARPVIHLLPHTHWDREWYLSRAAFQARLIPMMDDLLTLLEADPSLRFVLDGQTVLLEDYLAVRPEAAGRIGAAVGRGALEVGPWYVLADELIPAGESLIRNLLEGARDAERFGRRMEVLYSPDAFGHPAILPTLAGEFGLGGAVLWRGLGRLPEAPRDFLRWEGPDGHAVLVYHLPPEGYSDGLLLVPNLIARRTVDQVAVLLGGDHHGPALDLPGIRDREQAGRPDCEVRVSGLTEFFTSVEALVPSVTVSGELRQMEGHAWVLQGVHGTRSRMKRRHARVELALTRLAEPLAALAGLAGGRDRRPLLRHAWRTLLQAQFHDTICGCTGDDAAREQEVRLGSVEDITREIATRSLWDLAGHDPDRARQVEQAGQRLLLWNPCPRLRSGVITAELTFFRRDVPVGPPRVRPRIGDGYAPFALEDAQGVVVPVQVMSIAPGQERLDADRDYPDLDEVERVVVAFRAPAVEGLALASFVPRPVPHDLPGGGVRVGSRTLANDLVRVSVSPTGAVTLTDLGTGERYRNLMVMEREGDAGDTYTFAPSSKPSIGLRRPVSQKVTARGPLVGAIDTAWIQAGLACRLRVALHADSPLVRLRFEVDNTLTGCRVRLRFPVRAGERAVAGAAFGTESRPVVKSSDRHTAEQAVATAPAHRHVAAADGLRGLALFAPGFFEYEWTARQDLLLTVFRAVGELSREDMPERMGHAAWPQPTPLAQEPGRHTLDLCLAPSSTADLARPDRLERLWEDAFLPVQASFLRQTTMEEVAGHSVTLEGDGLVPTAVKPFELGRGLVLRCYNATGTAVSGRWRISRRVTRAALVRGDETLDRRIRLGTDRRVVPFTAGPRRIVTVKVIPAGTGDGTD